MQIIIIIIIKDELVALNEKFMQARGIYDTMLSSSLARYSAPTSSYGFAPMYNNNNNNSINPSYDQNQYNNNTYNQNNYQSAPTAQPYYADPQSQTPQQPPQSTFNYNNSNQPYPSESYNTNQQQQQPPYNPQQQQQQPTSYVQNY